MSEKPFMKGLGCGWLAGDTDGLTPSSTHGVENGRPSKIHKTGQPLLPVHFLVLTPIYSGLLQ